MTSKAEKQGLSPAGRVVQMVVMQVLHLFSLHFHHGGLGELVTLLLGQIHHVLRARGLSHLLSHLGIRLHQGCKGNQG